MAIWRGDTDASDIHFLILELNKFVFYISKQAWHYGYHIYWTIYLLSLTLQDQPRYTTNGGWVFFLLLFIASAMASSGAVGFVGLDDLSLELAASLIRSGYAVKAFEVFIYFCFLFFPCIHSFPYCFSCFWSRGFCRYWSYGMRQWSSVVVIFFFFGCSFLVVGNGNHDHDHQHHLFMGFFWNWWQKMVFKVFLMGFWFWGPEETGWASCHMPLSYMCFLYLVCYLGKWESKILYTFYLVWFAPHPDAGEVACGDGCWVFVVV